MLSAGISLRLMIKIMSDLYTVYSLLLAVKYMLQRHVTIMKTKMNLMVDIKNFSVMKMVVLTVSGPDGAPLPKKSVKYSLIG